MNALIEIHYVSNDNKIMRRGSFPLKGKSNEAAALDFWKWIKNEHPFECKIERIIVDGEEITEKVMDFENAEGKKKSDIADDYLPF